jgi:hypothetical protein
MKLLDLPIEILELICERLRSHELPIMALVCRKLRTATRLTNIKLVKDGYYQTKSLTSWYVFYVYRPLDKRLYARIARAGCLQAQMSLGHYYT